MTNGFTRKTLFVSLLALFMFTTLSTGAFADPMNALAMNFDNGGGTVTGSFSIDATTHALTAFDFTTTDGSLLSGFTYNSSDPADAGFVASFSTLTSDISGVSIGLIQIFNQAPANLANRRNLGIYFSFTSLALNSTVTVCSDATISYLGCQDAGTGTQFQSGEQVYNASGTNPVSREVTVGGFTITDPPEGQFAFNTNPSPTGGSGGGGGGTTVPEPSSVVLLGVGIVGFAFWRRNRFASM